MSEISCSKGHTNPPQSKYCQSCGEFLQIANSNPENSLLVGTILRDRYKIKKLLGQGGFGRTYLIEDIGRFNELFVLKELTPVIQGTQALQKAEELFQREAVTLHKLQHPQIPRFWEFFKEDNHLFLIQDYIQGETYEYLLEQRLQQGQCFSEAEIIAFLQQLLPVLSYLHSLGIIHRDISPDNIICRADNQLPVLIDLGGVKQIPIQVADQGVASSFNGTSLGKIGYAPYEQMQQGIVAPHSDLYALAVTCVVLMTGKSPQELIDLNTLNWTWNQELNLNQHLYKILNRMLALRPVERFHSAEEILELFNPTSTTLKTELQLESSQNNQFEQNSFVINNSGQGHLFDSTIKIPDEIQGWNWGGFLLPWVWWLPNRVKIGLITWVDIIALTGGLTTLTVAVIFGIKGNEWAWKSRKWKSIAAFKRHQRAWAIAAFIVWGIVLLLVMLVVILIFILGLTIFGLSR